MQHRPCNPPENKLWSIFREFVLIDLAVTAIKFIGALLLIGAALDSLLMRKAQTA